MPPRARGGDFDSQGSCPDTIMPGLHALANPGRGGGWGGTQSTPSPTRPDRSSSSGGGGGGDPPRPTRPPPAPPPTPLPRGGRVAWPARDGVSRGDGGAGARA